MENTKSKHTRVAETKRDDITQTMPNQPFGANVGYPVHGSPRYYGHFILAKTKDRSVIFLCEEPL